jgi:hypothetical protein
MNSAPWAHVPHFCCLLLLTHMSLLPVHCSHFLISYTGLVHSTTQFHSRTRPFAVSHRPLSLRLPYAVTSLWLIPADTCLACRFLQFWVFLLVRVLLQGISRFALSLSLSLDSSIRTAPGRVTSKAWRGSWITRRRRWHQLQPFRYVSVCFVLCFH